MTDLQHDLSMIGVGLLWAIWARYTIPAIVALVLDRPETVARKPHVMADRTHASTNWGRAWNSYIWFAKDAK